MRHEDVVDEIATPQESENMVEIDLLETNSECRWGVHTESMSKPTICQAADF